MSIHPTAIVDRQAEIDPSVTVGPYCIIEGPVRLAAGTRLYQNVYITGETHIGENCVLHPGVIVGHEPQDLKYRGEPTGCRIGRGTILREYVTIHRGTTPDSATVVGEECFLLVGSHVAHNCTVGNKVTLINNVLLGGHVEVGDGATLGGHASVHQFVRIGELAMIAGYARVRKDVLPFSLVDTKGLVAGLNRVGLRRAETPREQLDEIRRAYRVWFSRELSRTQAIEQLASELRCPPGLRLLAFLQAESRRGLAGRSKKSKPDIQTCDEPA